MVGEVACAAPSYLTVIVEEAAKPEPETVTVEPTLPLVGFRAMADVTMNAAESVFELASVAVTV